LGKVQAGLEPTDSKPFDDVGAGTREIRNRDASGIYRVMYVAKFEEAIYVLHCFQKKTQVTSKQDKAIAAARYRAVVNARKEKR
jgi:phage-related protein